MDEATNKQEIAVETKKIIHSSNGRKYEVGWAVGFTLCRNAKRYNCFGIITNISDDGFTIKDVYIDQMKLDGELDIFYGEVKDGDLGTFSSEELKPILGI